MGSVNFQEKKLTNESPVNLKGTRKVKFENAKELLKSFLQNIAL